MKNLKYLCLALIAMSSSVFAYEKGWSYQNFYAEVEWCKQSIIYPNAQDYIAAGVKAGKSESELRTEAISMVPVFEGVARDMCYCTFNELAKDVPHDEFERGAIVQQYMAIPRCKRSLKEAMDAVKESRGSRRLE
ncbi:hypothetical protein EZI54_05915 [Marinobacter halodurans]|uniref:Uncharacterized protein n=1 Tax=Marinobacter halodurans TaxID=2528979 RepID=A0ABY1ZNR9_9GAMM|nr:hypothetical protein [Marinobacter halodurans]TBW57984.1 hypothetical protein EZI54_05915 [Marinobacter halodurans]